MRDFNRSGGNYNRGGSRFNDRGRGDRQMFDAICAECGRDCQVPFKPTTSKPIYCNNCFKGPDEGDKRDFRRDKPSFSRSNDRGYKQSDPMIANQLDAINRKLDEILKSIKIDK